MIIAAGLFSATTGLLMFFVTVDPFKFSHELVGLGFSLAIVLHIANNFRPFRKYFTQRVGAAVVALGLGVGILLLVLTMGDRSDATRNMIVERVGDAPIPVVASVLGIEVEELVGTLAENGIDVSNLEMSIQELAQRHDVDTEDVLVHFLDD